MVRGLVWMDDLSRRKDDVMRMLCRPLWWESKNTRLHACSTNFWQKSKIQRSKIQYSETILGHFATSVSLYFFWIAVFSDPNPFYRELGSAI
jgi:hypothetical protein